MQNILVVGSGFSGAIIAREIAEFGMNVDVIDVRDHIAGNCFTEVDSQTGIMVHRYGPHIFHTDNELAWSYVNRFCDMMPFVARVKATARNTVFSLPINLHTINQFYGKTFSPFEAERFIESIAERKDSIVSFEDQALAFVGPDLYEAFFKGYPLKQWGLHPRDLPASVLKRLPVRFSYDDNYFNHKYQGIPKEGYTEIVRQILDHERINVELSRPFNHDDRKRYDHVFFSGALDSWFDFRAGRLGYRTLRFEKSYHTGDFQGCAVMSYPDEAVPYTRVTEHKHFTPWVDFHESVVFHEYSSAAGMADEPYYPIRLAAEHRMLDEYIALAGEEKGVTFVGRLGTYRYLDMDVTIAEALAASRQFIDCIKKDIPMRPFVYKN